MKPHKGTTMEPMGILRFRTVGFEVMLGLGSASEMEGFRRFRV